VGSSVSVGVESGNVTFRTSCSSTTSIATTSSSKTYTTQIAAGKVLEVALWIVYVSRFRRVVECGVPVEWRSDMWGTGSGIETMNYWEWGGEGVQSQFKFLAWHAEEREHNAISSHCSAEVCSKTTALVLHSTALPTYPHPASAPA
jgi:hypothetical protein